MEPLEFKCPHCGHDLLDEVSTGILAYNELDIYPDGSVEYGEEELVHEFSRVHYACRKCGTRLGRSTGARPLVRWINRNCTFSVETIREKLGVSERQAQDIRAIIFNLEPLLHEGNHISTAERHLLDMGVDHSVASNDAALVLIAAKAVITGGECCGGPTYTPDDTIMLTICPPTHEHILGYHTEGKYYFWITLDELTQLEEQWKKKNNS